MLDIGESSSPASKLALERLTPAFNLFFLSLRELAAFSLLVSTSSNLGRLARSGSLSSSVFLFLARLASAIFLKSSFDAVKFCHEMLHEGLTAADFIQSPSMLMLPSSLRRENRIDRKDKS